MYVSVWPARMSAHHMHVVAAKARRGSPRTRVVDGYEPPCGWWELNSGPLQEQQVLLMCEPSL